VVENPTIMWDVYGGTRYAQWLLVLLSWSEAKARKVYKERFGARPALVERLKIRHDGDYPDVLVRVGPVFIDDVVGPRCSFH